MSSMDRGCLCMHVYIYSMWEDMIATWANPIPPSLSVRRFIHFIPTRYDRHAVKQTTQSSKHREEKKPTRCHDVLAGQAVAEPARHRVRSRFLASAICLGFLGSPPGRAIGALLLGWPMPRVGFVDGQSSSAPME